MEDFLTPQQISAKLQITSQTVWRWIRNKKLKAVRIGKGYRISEKELVNFLNKNKT